MSSFLSKALPLLGIFAFSKVFGQVPFDKISRRASSAYFGQAGQSLFGEARFDPAKTNDFGTAVALTSDGVYLAVGATKHDASVTSEGNGAIFIYHQDHESTNWTLTTSILGDTGEELGDRFSISDHSTRVAARRRPNGLPDHVQVYEVGSVLGSPLSNCAETGNTVSISPNGNRVAVSCEHYDSYAGLVEIFEWNEVSSDWDLMDTLDGKDFGDTTDNFFGFATAFDASGDRIAISAVFRDHPTTGPVRVGSVRVFEYNSVISSWVTLGNELFGNTHTGRFGGSLDLSDDGRTLVIGAPTTSAGEVHVYGLNPSNQWVTVGSVVVGEQVGDDFGRSVSLSSHGTRFAASSGTHDSNRGQVRVFEYDPLALEWYQVLPAIEGFAQGDKFGAGINSVGLSGDGWRVASGSTGALNQNGIETGSARVFHEEHGGLLVDEHFAPTTMPSSAPSFQFAGVSAIQTEVPTVALGKFDWDLERDGIIAAIFDETTKEEEIALSYNISLRTAIVQVLDANCSTSVSSSVVGVEHNTIVASQNHGKLHVTLDIKQETVVGSSIWRDGPTTGEGSIDLCVRVDLVLDDANQTSVNFHEQQLFLNIDLSQGFSIGEIDLVREDADLENQDVQAEYSLEACQCNSTFDCIDWVLDQGDDVYICVYSNDTNIEITDIEELDFTQDHGGITVAAIDNRTEDALTAVLQLGKRAVIRSQMRSDFFDEANPHDLKISGSAAITFVNDDGRRHLTSQKLQQEGDESFEVNVPLMSQEEENREALVGGLVGGSAGIAIIITLIAMRRRKDEEEDELDDDDDEDEEEGQFVGDSSSEVGYEA